MWQCSSAYPPPVEMQKSHQHMQALKTHAFLGSIHLTACSALPHQVGTPGICDCHEDILRKDKAHHVMRDTPTISAGPGTHLTVAACIPVLGNSSVST